MWDKLQLTDLPLGPGVIELSKKWFSGIKGDVSKAWAFALPTSALAFLHVPEGSSLTKECWENILRFLGKHS